MYSKLSPLNFLKLYLIVEINIINLFYVIQKRMYIFDSSKWGR